MATLASKIDKIIHNMLYHYLLIGNPSNRVFVEAKYKQILDEIMNEIDKDKEAMCEECPGNHLK